ncbi:MAG: 50S ribosomal protein L5 [Actinomycetota bacterium]|nr:50S ribosomal protein L5 [Actinomycetota bacterium]
MADKTNGSNGYVPRLKERYRSELVDSLKSDLSLGNVMEVPRPVKVVVNMGVGEASKDAKLLDGAIKDLTVITGQKPMVRRARKSIATFKIRQGMPIGAATTLRGDRMWDFLDRLTSVVLPRIRDFRGLNPKAFDGNGNYSLGLTEQLVFPELDYDDIDATRGMDITVVTTAKNDEEGLALLRALGFPFRQQRVEA